LRRTFRFALLLCCLAALTATASNAFANAVPPWQKCAQVIKKYPHGVGKVGALDKTSGERVSTFKRSNRLYRVAMSNNKGLDRDKDGIVCETQ
jgi:hypothetical protein